MAIPTAERDAVLLSEVRRLAASGELAEARERTGLTQSELARAIGVTHAAVSRWESGDRKPRGKPAIRLALLLRRLGVAGGSP